MHIPASFATYCIHIYTLWGRMNHISVLQTMWPPFQIACGSKYNINSFVWPIYWFPEIGFGHNIRAWKLCICLLMYWKSVHQKLLPLCKNERIKDVKKLLSDKQMSHCNHLHWLGLPQRESKHSHSVCNSSSITLVCLNLSLTCPLYLPLWSTCTSPIVQKTAVCNSRYVPPCVLLPR